MDDLLSGETLTGGSAEFSVVPEELYSAAEVFDVARERPCAAVFFPAALKFFFGNSLRAEWLRLFVRGTPIANTLGGRHVMTDSEAAQSRYR